MPQQTIHVLVNEQFDKSGFSVVRGYRNKVRAEEDLGLVQADSSLKWALVEVPLVGGRARNGKKKSSTPRRAAASSPV